MATAEAKKPLLQAPTNGVKTHTPTANSTEVKKEAQEEKPQNGIPTHVPEKSLNLTLKRIRELNLIADKRAKLIEIQDNLNGFKLSSDKTADKLLLTDSFGNKFESSNTTVIADVLALLKSSIQTVIDETEMMLTL
ncbi:MAG: hypothetical protein IPL09_07610 [Bacteroidetes bacterium]|nr:hypothetical protein [Bacteroidota bacterium]